MSTDGIRMAVLVSAKGRGTNMQALIEGCKSAKINGEVAVVIGTKEGSPALENAASEGVATLAISPKSFQAVSDYDAAVLQALQEHNVDLVCLAGYMRLLGVDIIRSYRHRVMNIHPALVPMFAGKGMYGHHVHEAVIERGVKVTGVTVHFVDEEYDHGPIIVQTPVLVEEDDDPDSLAARVLKQEHASYVRAVSLFADGKLKVENRKVKISA